MEKDFDCSGLPAAGAAVLALAQKKSSGRSAGSTRTVLVDKARVLESRGRPDMAAQLWQQILLSEPNNPEALAGLARDYKLMGNADRAGRNARSSASRQSQRPKHRQNSGAQQHQV